MRSQTTDYIEGTIQFRAPGLKDGREAIFVDPRDIPDEHPVPNLCAVSTNTKRFLSLNGYQNRIRFDESAGFKAADGPASRAALWGSYLYKNNIDGLFVFNTADAQSWDYQTIESGICQMPVWQHSRRVDSKGPVFLFPLDRKFAGPKTDNLPRAGFDTVAFKDKLPKVFWRGGLSGACARGRRMKWLRYEMPAFLQTQGESNDFELSATTIGEFLRVRVVDNLVFSSAADVAFSTPPQDALLTAGVRVQRWFKSPVRREAQSKYRYLLALEGNDFPSGLYWSLASNSVVFIPQRHWETALDYGLEAWTHYVPTGDSREEIEQAVDACESDLSTCEQIIDNAHRFVHRITDRDLRDTIDIESVVRYSGKFREIFSRESRSLYELGRG